MSGLRNPGLFKITLIVEADAQEAESLAERIETLACPHPVDYTHPDNCERRWMVIVTELSPEDAAEWEGGLNE